jgi:hypothetical protein
VRKPSGGVPGARDARKRAAERLKAHDAETARARARAATGKLGDDGWERVNGRLRRTSRTTIDHVPPTTDVPATPVADGPPRRTGADRPPASPVRPPRSRRAALHDSIHDTGGYVDFSPGTGGGMPAELHSMREDWPKMNAANHSAVDDVVARLRASAAAVEQSPSHRAVADVYRALAGEAHKLHEAINRADALSRSADATPRQAAEEVRGRPDPQAWHR